MGDEFEFLIVTQDRDLGDDAPYANVPTNQWCDVGKARVFYCSPDILTVPWLGTLISETPHDILYLNSFLAPNFTIKPLLARFFGKLPDKPLILAPRGEFSPGALKFKRPKKYFYITIAKLLGLYNNIIWHASSTHEAEDIIRGFKINKENIHVAMDLPEPVSLHPYDEKDASEVSETNSLRIIFLSRISPMKNLDYALDILANAKANACFDIYGPIEDGDYWRRCQMRIDSMPENIQIEYRGSIMPDQVRQTFAKYDLFLFPTHGENYGHVIAESLSAGTPVLLSDQTPWRDLEKDRLGWDLSLAHRDSFTRIIDNYAQTSRDERNERRMHIKQKIFERLSTPEVIEASRQLFLRAMKG